MAYTQQEKELPALKYQVQLLMDKLEELEESYVQLQREFREKCRGFEALKRINGNLSEELKLVQGQLDVRDSLIEQHGLVIVSVPTEDGSDECLSLISQ